MTNTTRKIATALGITGIIACGSIAMGATSADAASAYGNGNVNAVASYDTNDAYGAVRSGSAWYENDCVLRDDSCDAYIDADDDGICDNYASRHDSDNAQHHRERHSNSRNGYEQG